jgi:hypothetical protein
MSVSCKQLALFSFTDLDADDFDGLYQFAGPRAILECYEGATIEPLQTGSYVDDDGPYTGFLLKPLNEILNDRNTFYLPDDLSYTRIILDSIMGENDPCMLAGLGFVYACFCPDVLLGQYCGLTSMAGLPGPIDLYNKTSKWPLQLHMSQVHI